MPCKDMVLEMEVILVHASVNSLFFVQNSLTLERTAQGNGGHHPWRCSRTEQGTQYHVHVDKVVVSHRLDSILEDFSNLSDSVFL